ncbi:replication initiator protein [Apis mellifera associated microvirus 34]|nr:replication initiator protein [Apis mellifera associated microvirus 34]
MKCPSPNFVWPHDKVIAVPCGKCLVCLSNKRHDWSVRLMQEYKVSDNAFFVTLTYSDKYLPSFGVSKRHLQLFFKRVRKECNRLRYYAVGEYGSRTGRPHYHAIMFNVDPKVVTDCWTLFNKVTNKKEPIGLVHFGKVTEASVQYTLKYIVQKNEFPKELNPSFSLMSRGYGLGLNYLSDRMLSWHRDDDRVYMVVDGEKKRLPRYYKEKIWPAIKQEDYPQGWARWTWRREDCFNKARKEAEEAERYNVEKVRSEGYSNPEQVITEMRNAVVNRIQSKVAFTQKVF